MLARHTQQIRADDEGESVVVACPDHGSAIAVINQFVRGISPPRKAVFGRRLDVINHMPIVIRSYMEPRPQPVLFARMIELPTSMEIVQVLSSEFTDTTARQCTMVSTRSADIYHRVYSSI